MKLRNRLITEPGLLGSIVFGATFFIALIALQPQLALSQPQAQQSEQQPQQKPDVQQPNTSQPDQSTSKAVVVTGTIVKSGENFVLRDTSGNVYQLDAQDKAQPYEGKSVKVTGKLEAESKLLHVDTIEELSA